VLSPYFGQDRLAMLWSVYRDIIGRGQTCHVTRTDDGGETWSVARQGGTYLSGDAGCADMLVCGPPGNMAAVMGTFSGSWEVLTTMAPARAGLPQDDATAARDKAVAAVATIPTPQTAAAPAKGCTMFAGRFDGSVWVLPGTPR
jgi:hypothetical protein